MDSQAVTVVVPTHNRRDLLLRTLDSVLGQRGVDIAVLVVDDGGVDGTPEALEELGDPRLRVIRHEHSKGVSAARNAGLRLVETPWVAFVDDDDLWAPEKLRAQLDALAGDGGALWSCVGAVHVDDHVRVTSGHASPASGDLSAEMLRENAVPGGGSGVLVRTDLARAVGGFDEEISIVADWDFYLRLSMQSSVSGVDRYLLAHYEHADSMYHDPRGMITELHYMAHKFRRLEDGRSFQADPASWFVNFSLMARRLGDRRTAVALLLRGVRQEGVVPISAHAISRLRSRLRRVPVVVRAEDAVEPASWLARYR